MRLVIQDAAGETLQSLSWESQTLTVGSDPDCDIQLDSSEILERHCKIGTLRDGGAGVAALDPDEGVIVNGQRKTRHRLEEGDVLSLGPFEVIVEFEQEEDEPAPRRSAAASRSSRDLLAQRAAQRKKMQIATGVFIGAAALWVGYLVVGSKGDEPKVTPAAAEEPATDAEPDNGSAAAKEFADSELPSIKESGDLERIDRYLEEKRFSRALLTLATLRASNPEEEALVQETREKVDAALATEFDARMAEVDRLLGIGRKSVAVEYLHPRELTEFKGTDYYQKLVDRRKQVEQGVYGQMPDELRPDGVEPTQPSEASDS